MLTLSFYIAFAPAVAYADEVTDKINKLQIDLQKRVGDSWTLSPRNKSVGAGVEIGVSQSYPVTATTTATTAAGATTTNTATLTAQKIGSKIFTPTTANVAKRFAGGVATGLVAMALYDLLGKAVDYVMDPQNNRVKYKIPGTGEWLWSGTNKSTSPQLVGNSPQQACQKLSSLYGRQLQKTVVVSETAAECWWNGSSSYDQTVALISPPTEGYKSFDELAARSIAIADNPNHKDVATAQSGMQTVVGDMITNNEIDNSYFNDSSISNDTYNDITNNYITNITNQYPSVSVPSQGEMAQAAANGQSSVTKTTQNSNGSTTTTTTNFNTTNNTTNNNTTTNNTYNITNITVNNPVSKDDTTASTPASTTTPTASTPASTPKPTDSKPFELPAFCDWAKPVCDFIDWVKADPELEGSPVPTDNTPLKNPADFDKDYINVIAQCPDDVESQIPVGNMSFTLRFPMSPLCDFLSTYARPVIILMAYITAALSIGNAFRVGG